MARSRLPYGDVKSIVFNGNPGTTSFDAQQMGDQPATEQMLRNIIYPEKKKYPHASRS
jgi:hypothetical protein